MCWKGLQSPPYVERTKTTTDSTQFLKPSGKKSNPPLFDLLSQQYFCIHPD